MEPENDHQNPDNFTVQDLVRSAQAANITVKQAVINIIKTLPLVLGQIFG